MKEVRLSKQSVPDRKRPLDGELGQADGAESALEDFTEAIRLAPDEPHLYILRSHVLTLLGQDSSARADLETAARLGGDDNIPLLTISYRSAIRRRIAICAARYPTTSS